MTGRNRQSQRKLHGAAMKRILGVTLVLVGFALLGLMGWVIWYSISFADGPVAASAFLTNPLVFLRFQAGLLIYPGMPLLVIGLGFWLALRARRPPV